MADNLFTSVDKIVAFTEIGPNFDQSLIRQSALFAQQSIVRKRLGKALYDRLVAGIAGNNLTTVERTLIDDFIQDLQIQATLYEIADLVYARVTRSGFVQPNASPESTSASETVLNAKKESISQKMDLFDKRLTEYLLANRSTFPQLSASTIISSDRPDLSFESSSSFFKARGGAGGYTQRFLDATGVRVFSEPKSRFNG